MPCPQFYPSPWSSHLAPNLSVLSRQISFNVLSPTFQPFLQQIIYTHHFLALAYIGFTCF